VLCPFNLTQHDKAQCVYAHNWQDFRRKPTQFAYDPQSCTNWKSTDYILNYQDGCPLGFECTKCHGWKELEYHPLNYRTKQCNTKNCQKGRDCPFYHNTREKRAVSTNVNLKFFRHYPRNRIINNTFKRRSESLTNFHHQAPVQMQATIPSGIQMQSPYMSYTSHNEGNKPSPSMESLNSMYQHFSIQQQDPRAAEANLYAEQRRSSIDQRSSEVKDAAPQTEKKNAFQEKYRRKVSSGEEVFVPAHENEELIKKLFKNEGAQGQVQPPPHLRQAEATKPQQRNPMGPQEGSQIQVIPRVMNPLDQTPEKDSVPKDQRQFLFNILENDDS
jgi:hypothetical protein